MTISTKKKMNGTTAAKTGVRHRTATKSGVRHHTATKRGVRRRTATPAGRAVHRRAVAAARPVMQITVEREHLVELRDWGILAGASLAGWIVTAIAIDAV